MIIMIIIMIIVMIIIIIIVIISPVRRLRIWISEGLTQAYSKS